MSKWSERRWWHYVVIILAALLPVAGYITAIILLMRYQAPEAVAAGGFLGFFAALFGVIMPLAYFVASSASEFCSNGVRGISWQSLTKRRRRSLPADWKELGCVLFRFVPIIKLYRILPHLCFPARSSR